jgi:hypothetical protein
VTSGTICWTYACKIYGSHVVRRSCITYMSHIRFLDEGCHNGALSDSLWCKLAKFAFRGKNLLTITYQKYPNIPSHVPGTTIRCKRVIDARLRVVKKLPVVESSRRIIWDTCCGSLCITFSVPPCLRLLHLPA